MAQSQSKVPALPGPAAGQPTAKGTSSKRKASKPSGFTVFLKKASAIHEEDLKLAHDIDAMRRSLLDKDAEDPNPRSVKAAAGKVLLRATSVNGMTRLLRSNLSMVPDKRLRSRLWKEVNENNTESFGYVLRSAGRFGILIGSSTLPAKRDTLKKYLKTMSEMAWGTAGCSAINADIARAFKDCK